MGIEWETDGEDVTLPDEVLVRITDEEDCSPESIDECLASWLSDEYGWLVRSASWLRAGKAESRSQIDHISV